MCRLLLYSLTLIGSIISINKAEAYERFSFTFQTGHEEWTGGFADLPYGEEAFYELAWGWENLPTPYTRTTSCGDTLHIAKGMFLAGNNHSDDLFMFLKRKIKLEPNSRYFLGFQLHLETNIPENTMGIGGSPGESVYVKVGASAQEPQPTIEYSYYRMNIDKGNQSQGGENASVAGTLANLNVDPMNPSYQPMSLGTEGSIETDDSGEAWLLIGTDSGFEGATRVYITGLDVIAIRRQDL